MGVHRLAALDGGGIPLAPKALVYTSSATHSIGLIRNSFSKDSLSKILGLESLVIRRYVDKFVFENPGGFRISLREAINGGNSDPRNATILKMFSMLEIGERAGSGIPGIVNVWKKTFNAKPIYVQKFNPSRVITKLDISGYVSPATISSDKTNQKRESCDPKEIDRQRR